MTTETANFTAAEAAQILKRWRQDVPETTQDKPIIEKLERLAAGLPSPQEHSTAASQLAAEIVANVHQWEKDHPAFKRGQETREYKLAASVLEPKCSRGHTLHCWICNP
jgi:hypothetical protein